VIGVYRAGDSLLHRTPAGAKLLGLLVFTTLLLVFRSPVTMGVGLIFVVLLYAIAAYTPVIMLQQIWPMKWIVILLFPFQWWLAGWQSAVIVVGTLVLAVAAAGLVSLTTRTTDLLAVIERAIQPLRYVRVDPERVALLLTLTIRVVPVINGLVHDVRDARRARGMERSVRAYVTPVVIRTVGYAERLGDALVARGVDD